MNHHTRAISNFGGVLTRMRRYRWTTTKLSLGDRSFSSKMDRLGTEAAVLSLGFCLAYLLRFGGKIPPELLRQLGIMLAPVVAGRLLFGVLFGIHKAPWRYVSITDTVRLSSAYTVFSTFFLVFSLGLPVSWSVLRIPASVLVIDLFLSIYLGVSLRVMRRYLCERSDRNVMPLSDQKQRRFLLIGAGTLGCTVAKEMHSRPGIKLLGFLDDSIEVGAVISGIPVLGRTSMVTELVHNGLVDDVLICVPPTARSSFNWLWALIEHLPIRRKFIPSIEEILESTDLESAGETKSNSNGKGKPALLSCSNPTPKEPSTIRGQTILITGGAGFIGSSLAERLAVDNQVIILDSVLDRQPMSFTSLPRNANVRIAQANIMDGDALDNLAHDVDIVVHAAAIVGVNRVCNHPRETLETNFVGTSRLLHALESSRRLKRVIYFSTSEVFGVNSFRVHEDAPAAVGPAAEARWSYAIAKLAGEHLVKSYHRQMGMPIVTVRPFNVFGPRRLGAHAIRSFVVNALRDMPIEIHGDGSQIRSWCFIEDFCDALIEMMVRPEAVGEDFNIGNPKNTLTIFQLAQRVIQLAGSKSPIVFRETHIPDIDIRVPSLDKARRLLGYECKYDLDRALGLTIDWYRMHLPELCASRPESVSALHGRQQGSERLDSGYLPAAIAARP
jgi:nucleoside-diphosphate-sugar epimerase